MLLRKCCLQHRGGRGPVHRDVQLFRLPGPVTSSTEQSEAELRGFPKGNSHRIIDLGQSITTFGDGSDAKLWLPSGWGNAYIGTHKAYALGFDYNVTVRMNVPINSAGAIDGLNLFVKGTPGNRVIVTQPLYYHGNTRIDPKAVLQLGDGTKGNVNKNYRFYNKQISGMDTGIYSTSAGGGRILTADVTPGAAGDRIVDNGMLVVANARGALSEVGGLSLSDISGRGGLQQKGPAPLTLLSHISYRGRTTISGSTLVLSRSARGAASLATSSGVSLTGKSARLDLSSVGPQQLAGLAGVAGSRVDVGGHRLTLKPGAGKNSTFAGSVTDGGAKPGHGGGLAIAGAGRFTLTGKVTATGPVQVRSGGLTLGVAGPSAQRRVGAVAGPVSVAKAGTLGIATGSVGSLSSAGVTQLDGRLTVRAALAQTLVSFIVGLAMFGSIIYLPLYLQLVTGASATNSGLLLLPLMGGLLLTSIASGQAISRTGHYKIFPIIGMGLAALGMGLLSTMDVDTSRIVSSVYMFVLGAGLGLVMQVMVLATQNSVDRSDLGTATATVSFFRSVGGSIGVSLFGALFNNRLTSELADKLPAGVHLDSAVNNSVSAIRLLPAAVRSVYESAYSDSLTYVFAIGVPILIVGLVTTLLLKEKPMATTLE